MNDFAKTLKKLRTQAGYTQEQMAEKLDISKTQYSNYENGHNFPSTDRIVMLCEFFSVTADYLLRNEDDIFQNNATSAFFKELCEMDKDKSKTFFCVLEKLVEYKKTLEQESEEQNEE